MTAPFSTYDWSHLVRHDQVHGSLYTDEAIFQEELKKIWYRTWVYVGHVSEVPNPNDFIMKSIGPQPVIMSRDRDGQIHLLLNRCAHRGNQVCLEAHGNRSSFTCPYHGWTFSNNGALRGFPFASGYEGVDRSQLGLGKVPRLGIYNGFVFGSFAAEGPSLEEHLGSACAALDALVMTSPEGEVEITAGFLQHKAKANWKFLVENETDGYHPQFVHASIFDVASSGIGALYSADSTAVARDLGDGHTEIDLRPEFRRIGKPMGWFGTTEERLPEYVTKMRAAYGDQRANEIMIDGTPHIMIFPNLFIAEIQIFVIQALAVDETVQHVTALQFKGAPDLNRRLRQQTMGSVGPAGFLLADDSEMYERTQRGVQARDPEWNYVGRGMHRERRDAEGFLIGDATDEVTTRGIWSHYRKLMEAV
ncbi:MULTISPECIES: Rieske 2Fe-2S domain-containing protein [unclassified Pseudomonas]|uniref:aromatic ring-hydroxylating oxygenase subunit alpha n=1 Tax=unclassified Pseudomonas TaxID=196821 RepID=UPI000C88164F|nr:MULTISPECIES: aromatic ring-hydroxylating dioxygenase subunit alpha [unclassified Pseudomonas]PMX27458.1 ring-hydroxylating oxygenase subunit alpha [Pseudomonas sp. GW460-12]PMX34474.1 ring-hydroxylating oxygenase subunit alpha [Pseudomonas sp. MPR-R2A4]PMX41881.1 ring-hydroxylating oxygenase subunit alpha [Pseudomonas sp. MPR-R2A7]PMX53837.1 ring-hydroxylating oxygenase subunit alpha [Pseudomonas sp. MPR-R2A6]PMX91318.1 ring-hydroxylating oxygenase subunit alpha [Pseudomonas sp. MPR-R2A3]